MDGTYWILGGTAVLAVISVLSVLLALIRMALRRRGPLFSNILLRLLSILLMAWGATLLVGMLLATPWNEQSHWTNKLSLQEPIRKSPSPAPNVPSPLITNLANQVGDDGTLVAIAISGGGSRAAYFAAAVLEKLSKVKWPGENKGSLIEHANLVSSVSGGSLAAAYFVLNGPGHSTRGSQSLKPFFERFKTAMATNLELPAIRELFDPRNTLSMLALKRPLAEAISNVMDDVLTGGMRTKMAELQRRATDNKAPILLLNATRLDNTNPLVFAVDNQDRPIFTLARTPDNSSLPKLGGSGKSTTLHFVLR